MKKILLVAIIAVGIKWTLTIKAPTPGVHERLAILKHKLVEDIHKKQISVIPIENDFDPLESHSQVVRGPITPVRRRRKRRRTTRVIRRTTTTTTTTEVNNITFNDYGNVHTVKPLRSKARSRAKKWAKHLKKYGKPREIFYRRDTNGLSEAEIRKRHSLLCVDLLRPVLTGMKKNATVSKIVGDQTANRLIQLLSYGNSQTPEEIESILYQINNLHLRFFQWEVISIKKLFNFIMPGQRHSFRSMKYGVKRIFELWHMDLSDTNLLIKESRMFRPPCIGTSEGSTRSSMGTRYTRPVTPKSTCAPRDKKCLVHAESSSFEN